MAPETASRLAELPKGDALATAQLAGIMAAKRTSELIPLCHPLPLTHIAVELQVGDGRVEIEASAETAAQTGVEMEALVAASVAALTIYDMAKAVDSAMEIGEVRLLEKVKEMKAAVVTVSDGVSEGTREDASGDLLAELLAGEGYEVERRVVPDERDAIADAIVELARGGGCRAHDRRNRGRPAGRHARGHARRARARGARNRGGDPRRLDREDAACAPLARAWPACAARRWS